MSYVKICGVTCADDLEAVIGAGADAVGLNLWPASPRSIGEAQAHALVQQARGRIETVLVLVNHPEPHALRDRTGADWVQLHGDEGPAEIDSRSFKAIGLANEAHVHDAMNMPGDRILVDARDPRRRGGTGQQAPTALARRVASERRCVLAGGLGPDTVADAIAAVSPWGVDTASGVEVAAGRKDKHAIHAFVEAAKRAFSLRS